MLSPKVIDRLERWVVCALCVLLVAPCLMQWCPTAAAQQPQTLPQDFPISPEEATMTPIDVLGSDFDLDGDSINILPVDTVAVAISPAAQAAADSVRLAEMHRKPLDEYNLWVPRPYDFNPDPTRAVWMSALFPGLGQVYNRRYWKLPIIVGAYMGLAYATSWNNSMLSDYTLAYRDIMDSDPSTKSYMDFFPPTVTEESLDKAWLTKLLQSRKNYYRRYRDLCIICMVGVYLLAMVDAYVDASLSHFDISTDLSLDWSPAIIPDQRNRPAIGVGWALNF